MKAYVHLWYCFIEFFLEWEMLQTKIVEKNQNTYFMFKTFSKNHTVFEVMWKKYGTAGQATDDNMTHAHWMLDY